MTRRKRSPATFTSSQVFSQVRRVLLDNFKFPAHESYSLSRSSLSSWAALDGTLRTRVLNGPALPESSLLPTSWSPHWLYLHIQVQIRWVPNVNLHIQSSDEGQGWRQTSEASIDTVTVFHRYRCPRRNNGSSPFQNPHPYHYSPWEIWTRSFQENLYCG